MNLVRIENGRPVTDSLTVAETFGRRHADVLRSIDNLECSQEFNERNFASVDYKDGKGEQRRKVIMTQDGFSFLVMGYTGKEAARFKEMYIAEFGRMREELNAKTLPAMTPAEVIAAIANQNVEQERRIAALESGLTEAAKTMEAVKETFLQRDEDWRKKINGMLNGAAYRMGGHYRDLRNQSYLMLEERGRCDLDKRLRNLVERLEMQGATKTQLKNTSRMDVIEADARLKEIYTTIVKELAIGALV